MVRRSTSSTRRMRQKSGHEIVISGDYERCLNNRCRIMWPACGVWVVFWQKLVQLSDSPCLTPRWCSGKCRWRLHPMEGKRWRLKPMPQLKSSRRLLNPSRRLCWRWVACTGLMHASLQSSDLCYVLEGSRQSHAHASPAVEGRAKHEERCCPCRSCPR